MTSRSSRSVPEWIGKTPDTRPPPRVLQRIFEREKGFCYLAERKIRAGEKWQADHKIALINGGENRESNLFPVLVDKHKEKTKVDVAEKSRIASRAQSHIGVPVAPANPIPGKKLGGHSSKRSQHPTPMPPRRDIFGGPIRSVVESQQ